MHIEKFEVRSQMVGEGLPLSLYFDSGSPFTFIKYSVANQLGNIFKLPDAVPFLGLGDGQFFSTHMMHLEVELLEIWCRQFAYVVPDELLKEGEDMLIGHDFMQRYDIKLDTKERRVILDKTAILRGLRVR